VKPLTAARRRTVAQLESLTRATLLLQTGESPGFLSGRVLAELLKYGKLTDADSLTRKGRSIGHSLKSSGYRSARLGG